MLSISVFFYFYVVFLTILLFYVVFFVMSILFLRLFDHLLLLFIRAKFNWELRKSILMKRIKVKTKGMMIYDEDDDDF